MSLVLKTPVAANTERRERNKEINKRERIGHGIRSQGGGSPAVGPTFLSAASVALPIISGFLTFSDGDCSDRYDLDVSSGVDDNEDYVLVIVVVFLYHIIHRT